MITKIITIVLALIILTLGSAAVLAVIELTCDLCGGEGSIKVFPGRITTIIACPKCGGEGKVLGLQTFVGQLVVAILGIGAFTAIASVLKPSWISLIPIKKRPFEVVILTPLNIIAGVFFLNLHLRFSFFPYLYQVNWTQLALSILSWTFLVYHLIPTIWLGYYRMLLIGIFYLLAAYGLWNRKVWAWVLSLISTLISVFVSLISLYSPTLLLSVIGFILNLFIILYLTRPHVREFFRKSI